MVARGDLGVEMPAEEVPHPAEAADRGLQRLGKPAITATQMLESMVAQPRPTRAEASDVANAILDGTDAVMLSAETATGRYPVEAVRVMARIAERADRALAEGDNGLPVQGATAATVTDAISLASCNVARGSAPGPSSRRPIRATRRGWWPATGRRWSSSPRPPSSPWPGGSAWSGGLPRSSCPRPKPRTG